MKSRPIAHTIIGPAHPGAHHALMTEAKRFGYVADRCLLPWELLQDSHLVREGAFKATRKFLTLHSQIEYVDIFTHHGFGRVAGEMADMLYAYAADQKIRVQINITMLNYLHMEVPNATIITCGDGRQHFWRVHEHLHKKFGHPRIIAIPGEEQWLRNNPAIAAEIDAWLGTRHRVPRIVVKHGGEHDCSQGYHGCGYRGLKGSHLQAEMEVARSECVCPNTHYYFAPADGRRYLIELQKPANDTRRRREFGIAPESRLISAE